MHLHWDWTDSLRGNQGKTAKELEELTANCKIENPEDMSDEKNYVTVTRRQFMAIVQDRIDKGRNVIYKMAPMSCSGDIVIPTRNGRELALLQVRLKNSDGVPNDVEVEEEVTKSRLLTKNCGEDVTNVLVICLSRYTEVSLVRLAACCLCVLTARQTRRRR